MFTPEFIGTLVYGLLSLAGGILGYIKSQSKISLISGGVSGLLLLVLATMMNGGNQLIPFLAAVLILLMTIVFVIRWSKTKKFMPAIPMIFFGVVALIMILS